MKALLGKSLPRQLGLEWFRAPDPFRDYLIYCLLLHALLSLSSSSNFFPLQEAPAIWTPLTECCSEVLVWFQDSEGSLCHNTIKNSSCCHCTCIYFFLFSSLRSTELSVFSPSQWANKSLLPPLTPPKTFPSPKASASLLTNCLGSSDVEIIHNCLIYLRLCGKKRKSTLERSII